MPSVLSLFRHSRDMPRPVQAGDDGQRTVAKKRRSRFSMVIPGSSSRTARKSAPFDSALEPLEWKGAAMAADVPELPSFPLYQHFASTRHLSDSHQRRQRYYEKSEPRGDRRLSRAATVSDFHSLRPQSELIPRKSDVTTLSTNAPPACDRAVELARLYRSILPDFRTICEEEEEKEEDEEKKKGETRENEGGRREREAGGYGGQRPKNGSLGAASTQGVTEKERDRRKDGGLCPETHAGEPPHRPAGGCSSLTAGASKTSAVKHHKFPDGAAQRHQHHRPSDPNTPGQSKHAWPLPIRPLPPSSSPQTTATPETTEAGLVRETENEHDDRSILSQHSTVGLQICTELLVDRLIRALGLQRRHERGGHAGPSSHGRVDEGFKVIGEKEMEREEGDGTEHRESSSKQLEMLLLIEAYEGLLGCCRRETAATAATMTTKTESVEAGAGGNNAAQPGADRSSSSSSSSRPVAEAVPILEHWLETLHALYEATFEERGEA
ncbi:hypothetical protein MYCTH_89959 [Thermothelomyces thermophilus ATCC 42464]|uniref:Uncharacterized protein n=1 Tax=Thermothelomyces thermophilus (strain ATCC 42464 / BCRC 31852 / DSM 1799) TaxID=573729 RepID=G2QM47_THET4|nr:uncharacterized protein MYCTH_89959 [Thermothelomyces thermophilus ATCC 42464]AEO61027.1 hypothetical protein MYCTH_89959 [Thermothelomyces thermophilus ATCC 42464]